MKSNEYNMHLNMITCLNSSNDIFNYHNKGMKLLEMNIPEGFYFVRNKNNIRKISQQSDINTEKGEDLLFRIRKSKKNDFTIENPLKKNMPKTINNIKSLNNKLWYILKSETNENESNNLDDYILNKNDIIKFGASEFEVIEKHIENCNHNENKNKEENKYDISNFNKNSQSLFQIPEIKDADYSNKNLEILCRICFGGESTIDNPKIKLCKCNDYIHYNCLKQWIKTNIFKKENKKKNTLTYFLKKFNCDVCLQPYLLKFKIFGLNKIYSLIDLQLPKKENYIVLESLGLTLHNNNPKVIHIIKLINEEITIGRNEFCDVFICGPYVSRIHAVIKYNNKTGDVILENKSKNFDSLILVRNPIKINESKIDFQVGRTIITANLTKNKLN